MSRGKFLRIQKDHYCIVGCSQIKFILSENVCEVATNFCSKLKQQNKKSYDLDLFLALDLSGIVNLEFFLIPLWFMYESFKIMVKINLVFSGLHVYTLFGLLDFHGKLLVNRLVYTFRFSPSFSVCLILHTKINFVYYVLARSFNLFELVKY